MNILVVDDSRLMRSCIKSNVSGLINHCTYIEAENGEEAFKLVQTHKVDFVFLDWEMPKVTGMDFLKAVRKIDRFRYLPIIMVTSDDHKEHIVEAVKEGVTDYILKPINNHGFREKMLKHFYHE